MTNEEILIKAKRLEMDGDIKGATALRNKLKRGTPKGEAQGGFAAMTRTRGLVGGSKTSESGSETSQPADETPQTETSDEGQSG